MLVRALLLAVFLLTFAAPSAFADFRTVTAAERPEYTGWASVTSSGCAGGDQYTVPGTSSPYCVMETFGSSQLPKGIWAYSYTYGRWLAYRFPSQVYVYATPKGSQFAWTWTASYGFTVMDKRHIGVEIITLAGCAACN